MRGVFVCLEVNVPAPMFESKASGGPLDGVKLSAPITWDGMVREPDKGDRTRKWYRGFYKWNFEFKMWMWQNRSHPYKEFW